MPDKIRIIIFKDNRQFKNIVEFIEALSKFRLTSIDNLHGNIESMCVFPSIKYNSNKGYIEYTLEDSIEYCVLNTTFIGESGSKNGNPKKYFTAIDIKPIKYNKPTIDKLTGEVIGYKETSLSVACIGVLNFLIRNMHLWYNDKYGKNTVLELDEDMGKNNIVLISEYYMPECRFKCIWQMELKTTLGSGVNNTTDYEKVRVEKLFIYDSESTTN